MVAQRTAKKKNEISWFQESLEETENWIWRWFVFSLLSSRSIKCFDPIDGLAMQIEFWYVTGCKFIDFLIYSVSITARKSVTQKILI